MLLILIISVIVLYNIFINKQKYNKNLLILCFVGLVLLNIFSFIVKENYMKVPWTYWKNRDGSPFVDTSKEISISIYDENINDANDIETMVINKNITKDNTETNFKYNLASVVWNNRENMLNNGIGFVVKCGQENTSECIKSKKLGGQGWLWHWQGDHNLKREVIDENKPNYDGTIYDIKKIKNIANASKLIPEQDKSGSTNDTNGISYIYVFPGYKLTAYEEDFLAPHAEKFDGVDSLIPYSIDQTNGKKIYHVQLDMNKVINDIRLNDYNTGKSFMENQHKWNYKKNKINYGNKEWLKDIFTNQVDNVPYDKDPYRFTTPYNINNNDFEIIGARDAIDKKELSDLFKLSQEEQAKKINNWKPDVEKKRIIHLKRVNEYPKPDFLQPPKYFSYPWWSRHWKVPKSKDLNLFQSPFSNLSIFGWFSEKELTNILKYHKHQIYYGLKVLDNPADHKKDIKITIYGPKYVPLNYYDITTLIDQMIPNTNISRDTGITYGKKRGRTSKLRRYANWFY